MTRIYIFIPAIPPGFFLWYNSNDYLSYAYCGFAKNFIGNNS